MFGGGGRTRTSVQRGSDLRYDLEITLEEAAGGKDEKLRIPRLEKCEECDGSGNLLIGPSGPANGLATRRAGHRTLVFPAASPTR